VAGRIGHRGPAEKQTTGYCRIFRVTRSAVWSTGSALLALFVALSSVSYGADANIPPTLQAAILAKMLAYDRSLKTRAGASIDVGVVFKESDKLSAEAGAAMVKAFEAMGAHIIQGLPMRVTRHPYKDTDHFAQWLKGGGVDLVYVVGGLGKEREAIHAASVEAKAVTVGADRSQVEAGLAVAVVLKGATPRILVNIASAQAVGMSLDPKLLELSDVIR
jgi:hypothetical protein